MQLPLPHVLWQTLSINQSTERSLALAKPDWTVLQNQWTRMVYPSFAIYPPLLRVTHRIEYMAKFGDFRFASLRLEAENKKRFETWVTKEKPDPLTAMVELGGEGFKVSATYVVDQNSWCFTIVGTAVTKLHKDMGLSSWSDDLGEAILMSWFKHKILCDGGEWPLEDKTQRWG